MYSGAAETSVERTSVRQTSVEDTAGTGVSTRVDLFGPFMSQQIVDVTNWKGETERRTITRVTKRRLEFADGPPIDLPRSAALTITRRLHGSQCIEFQARGGTGFPFTITHVGWLADVEALAARLTEGVKR